jgi:AcrR family transcriptional regulator
MRNGKRMPTAPRETKPIGRGQITRERLLECSIELIAETGYANTTTQAILDRSSLSRGSLLHQFSTRHELMVASGRWALEKMLDTMRQKIARSSSPLEGMFLYPDMMWESMIENPALAFYEIQMASRWDVDLLNGLRSAMADAELYIEATVRALGRKYQMVDVEGYLVDLSVVNDSLPNLAARRALTREPSRIDNEREKIKAWHTHALNSRLPQEFQRMAGPAI